MTTHDRISLRHLTSHATGLAAAVVAAIAISSCSVPSTIQPVPTAAPPTSAPPASTSASPLPTHTIPPSVTPTPPTLPSTYIQPFPTVTPLPLLFDGFDDGCITIERWSQTVLTPTPIIRQGCFDFSGPDKTRHFVETATHLTITDVEGAAEGLMTIWRGCQVREIQLVVSGYMFVGTTSAWLGLSVPHPEGDKLPISVWISSKDILGSVLTKAVHSRSWNGSITSSDSRILAESVPQNETLVLGIHFTGEEALVAVGNVPGALSYTVDAVGFPDYFVVSYAVAPGSELSFKINEVLALPQALTTGCRLSTLTPSP